jgi:hypothetical protein
MIGYELEREEDEYAQREATLVTEIGKLRLLRDAQAPGSGNFSLFQGRIDTLTAALLALQQSAPDLRKLDSQIYRAITDIESAEAQIDRVGTGRMVGAALVGLVGLAFLVLSVVSWGLAGVVIGLVLLAGGGLALWVLARGRRLSTDDKDDALERLAGLQDRHEALLKGSTGKTETRETLNASRPAESAEGVFADAARGIVTPRD